MRPAILLAWGMCVAGLSDSLQAAQLHVLDVANWNDVVPSGKEVDCIYGDILLRNDQIVAVIAAPRADRNANMTVRGVGGSIIDLTRLSGSNDQLSALYAGGQQFSLLADPSKPKDAVVRFVESDSVSWGVSSPERENQATLEVRYELADGADWIQVTETYRNPHGQPVDVELRHAIRADRSFDFTPLDDDRGYEAYDAWWRAAYAVQFEEHTIVPLGDTVNRGRPVWSLRVAGQESSIVTLNPGDEHVVRWKAVPAVSQLELRGRLKELAGSEVRPVSLSVNDTAGPVANTQVSVVAIRDDASDEPLVIGEGRTDVWGQLEVVMTKGSFRATVKSLDGRQQDVDFQVNEDPVSVELELPLPGYVRAQITDELGRRIPCKIEFRGVDGTESPFFGPDTYESTIHNLVYTASGQFRQEIAPGHYDVTISHGPEFDAVVTRIAVEQAKDTPLVATLKRVVDTTGWISSDFHSHSSPSGDNTSSQRGRVLNLLAEHIEFAPCTEHNRISTYVPHLQFLSAEPFMATCSGMELTGQPLPVNHQNAFPLAHHPRTQDGGGPTTDENPVVQIERLAFWDRRADKVVQGNHPNLMQVLGDRDLDGQPDGGFERMLEAMDVVEVHPPAAIFDFPTEPPPRGDRPNTIFNWLQLLNQGYHIPGVVNTDAHYNFHGSGWLRNYLRSPTDDPAKVIVADMIHAAEAGQMVMTNGPYLEVSAESQLLGERRVVGPGDSLVTQSGTVELKIRVQCANWLDVNRVQLFINGRPDPELDFRRGTHPDDFRSGTVRFEKTLNLQLPHDAHVIVAAAGEGLRLGSVVGPDHQDDMPVAVANPIYVDVDGNGFRPNGDTLGLPIPTQD